jgi:hypothetical protein
MNHSRLSILAAEICSAHSEAISAQRRSLEKAIEAGERLIEAKAMLSHGEWLPWLKQNCPDVSDRTAQRYMHLAKHKNDTVSDLSAAPKAVCDPAAEISYIITATKEQIEAIKSQFGLSARPIRGEGKPGVRPHWWHGAGSSQTREMVAKHGYLRDARGPYNYAIRSPETGEWVFDGTAEFEAARQGPRNGGRA